MKWVPKVCPAIVTSPPEIVPPVIDDCEDDVIEDGSKDILDVAPPSSNDFSWDSSEQAWIHEPSKMRFDPNDGRFYKYVGGDEEGS